MPQTRRAQATPNPEEHERQADIAQRDPVSGLVRWGDLPAAPNRAAIVSDLLAMQFPITEDWRKLEQLMEDARLADSLLSPTLPSLSCSSPS